MRAITSREIVLKKLLKHNLISDGHICYLSDFHKTKIGKVVAVKLINERILEPTKAMSSWFEKEWRLRKPVGIHKGVFIFNDEQRNQFFFTVKKGTYDLDTYQICINKIDYLEKLGEKLTK